MARSVVKKMENARWPVVQRGPVQPGPSPPKRRASLSSQIRDRREGSKYWSRTHADWNAVDHLVDKTGWYELEPLADLVSLINPLGRR